MCGHVGIAGKLEYKDELLMKRLLVMDYFRGPDSTGLAAIKKDGESVKISKLASHPFDLFDMKSFQDTLNGCSSQVFLGHNRAATKGKVTTFNAHPYHYGRIVGAHNGTLEQSSWKALEKELGVEFNVDSQAVIYAIDKLGIEKTVEFLQGAWALIWYDTEEKTLNFLRNSRRPLWYAFNDKFDHLYWASEYPIMSCALGEEVKAVDLAKDENGAVYFPFATDYLYTISLNTLKAGGTERPKFKVKEVKAKEVVVTTTSPFPRHTSNANTSTNNSGGTTNSRGTTTTTTNKGIVVHLFGNDDEPFGSALGLDKFDEYAKFGCGWCQEPVSPDDKGITIIESLPAVICSKCACNRHNEDVRIYSENIAKVV